MNIYLLERSLAPSTTADEFRYAQTARLFGSLQRSTSKSLKNRHFGAVNALDIERINAR
jgi:hypothetical protein